MKNKLIMDYLDQLFPNPKCELNYNEDYELLIAVMLSARSTDKTVNKVTEVLFKNRSIFDLADIDINEITNIIRPVGSFEKKSRYIKSISNKLVKDFNGIVPNNRTYLESLPGVGRKTCNVVLSILFKEPCIAVDTHVERISKRLSLVSDNDSVLEIEKKLYNLFPKMSWIKLHLQFVLFGRYYCKSRNPKCLNCKLKKYCKYKKSND